MVTTVSHRSVVFVKGRNRGMVPPKQPAYLPSDEIQKRLLKVGRRNISSGDYIELRASQSKESRLPIGVGVVAAILALAAITFVIFMLTPNSAYYVYHMRQWVRTQYPSPEVAQSASAARQAAESIDIDYGLRPPPTESSFLASQLSRRTRGNGAPARMEGQNIGARRTSDGKTVVLRDDVSGECTVTGSVDELGGCLLRHGDR